ncbi:hypothetical protein KAJ27_11035, partial [bacterium]|nr:hypothetical protein [bacterium]
MKSLGSSVDEFLGWLVYYFATLPIFLAHTYIVVYWGGKLMMKGYRLILFILLFIFCLYFFSVLEILVSYGLLAKWFPEIFQTDNNYLAGSNILISGIGNLYIVLVFIAVKIIRTWYISSEEQKNISQRKLEDKMAVVNSRIQPDLLMYATGRLEKMAEKNSDKIPSAIAILAEILNGVM